MDRRSDLSPKLQDHSGFYTLFAPPVGSSTHDTPPFPPTSHLPPVPPFPFPLILISFAQRIFHFYGGGGRKCLWLCHKKDPDGLFPWFSSNCVVADSVEIYWKRAKCKERKKSLMLFSFIICRDNEMLHFVPSRRKSARVLTSPLVSPANGERFQPSFSDHPWFSLPSSFLDQRKSGAETSSSTGTPHGVREPETQSIRILGGRGV